MTDDKPQRIAYLDMGTGISGDMFVGAMIDAGCPLQRLQDGLEGLGLQGVRLEARRVTRRGLGGTKFDVIEEGLESQPSPLSPLPQVGEELGGSRSDRWGGPSEARRGEGLIHDSRRNRDHHHEHDHDSGHSHGHGHPHGHPHSREGGHDPHGRHFSEIARMIERGGLPDPVRVSALAVFRAIGEAEAHLHNATIEDIHFHEVGAVDSIADVVGACLAVHEMGVERMYASEVPLCGGGTVTFSHGIVPLPAPATLELLKGIPTRTSDLKTELVTPTGAALLRVLCAGFGPRPDMVVDRVGYGAGTKDFSDRPNLLRVSIGRPL